MKQAVYVALTNRWTLYASWVVLSSATVLHKKKHTKKNPMV